MAARKQDDGAATHSGAPTLRRYAITSLLFLIDGKIENCNEAGEFTNATALHSKDISRQCLGVL
jgi:hypothetical protein